jgi:hypothetical protein
MGCEHAVIAGFRKELERCKPAFYFRDFCYFSGSEGLTPNPLSGEASCAGHTACTARHTTVRRRQTSKNPVQEASGEAAVHLLPTKPFASRGIGPGQFDHVRSSGSWPAGFESVWSMFRRGFKTWAEEIALRVRHKLNLPDAAPLDPSTCWTPFGCGAGPRSTVRSLR